MGRFDDIVRNCLGGTSKNNDVLSETNITNTSQLLIPRNANQVLDKPTLSKRKFKLVQKKARKAKTIEEKTYYLQLPPPREALKSGLSPNDIIVCAGSSTNEVKNACNKSNVDINTLCAYPLIYDTYAAKLGVQKTKVDETARNVIFALIEQMINGSQTQPSEDSIESIPDEEVANDNTLDNQDVGHDNQYDNQQDVDTSAPDTDYMFTGESAVKTGFYQTIKKYCGDTINESAVTDADKNIVLTAPKFQNGKITVSEINTFLYNATRKGFASITDDEKNYNPPNDSTYIKMFFMYADSYQSKNANIPFKGRFGVTKDENITVNGKKYIEAVSKQDNINGLNEKQSKNGFKLGNIGNIQYMGPMI